MNTTRRWTLAAILAASAITGGFVAADSDDNPQNTLVLYCGRSQSLVGPLIEEFTRQTGIQVQVKYAGTPQLVGLLQEEADKSPADLFWAQDAASLGTLAKANAFVPLPENLINKVSPRFRSHSGLWIATSARARVLAYSPARVKANELPRSVFELTNPKWKGRVGWAPGNASFQAFVTAMRTMHGDKKTLNWLNDMKSNGAKAYPKNLPIVEAIAAGEIDLGLPNHYYLLRKKAEDPNFPVEQTFFADGCVGNLLLVSGIGVTRTSRHTEQAEKFIEFMLSPNAAQSYFASDDMEYSVVEGVTNPAQLPGADALQRIAPDVNLDDLNDLEGTQKLLREAGLI